MNIKDALNQATLLASQISIFCDKLGYCNEDIQYNRNDPNETFLFNELYILRNQLEKAQHQVDYLKRPIKLEGKLRKNAMGRYEIADGHYFTSGSTIEFLKKDSYGEEYWKLSSIEHRDDYYIVGLGPDVSIEGIYCRYR